jgi:Cu/Ag efflux protein CusF
MTNHCQERMKMNNHKQNLLALAVVISTLFNPLLAWADEYAAPTEAKAELSDTTTAVDDRYTQGEIRKVDIAQGKLTIKHGDIKNLGMPGMTMVFRVKDPAMVKTVKAGDAVQFVVELEKGMMVITELKKKP